MLLLLTHKIKALHGEKILLLFGEKFKNKIKRFQQNLTLPSKQKCSESSQFCTKIYASFNKNMIEKLPKCIGAVSYMIAGRIPAKALPWNVQNPPPWRTLQRSHPGKEGPTANGVAGRISSDRYS